MRVLHVLAELRPSGAEVCLRVAAPRWAEHGVTCEILSVGPERGPYAGVLERAGYPVTHLPQDPYRSFLGGYARLLRDRRFDVVHLHVERANFYNALAARAVGVRRVVLSVHNVFAFTGALRRERRLQRAVLRRAGMRFLSVSASVERGELATFANPTTRILNWYDDARFVPADRSRRAAARERLGLDDDTFAAVSVGNCSEVKNHTEALRALARLAADRPVAYLHVGVEEPGEPERRLAAELGIAGHVRFLGALDDVAPVLAAADCVLMPSHYEGMSIAALESLASGLPAVFADVPGLSDFREFGVPVTWVGTRHADIFRGLAEVAALDPTVRAARGVRGAAIVAQHFGAARGVAEYAALYGARPAPLAPPLREVVT